MASSSEERQGSAGEVEERVDGPATSFFEQALAEKRGAYLVTTQPETDFQEWLNRVKVVYRAMEIRVVSVLHSPINLQMYYSVVVEVWE
jgi:hypothetical protein